MPDARGLARGGGGGSGFAGGGVVTGPGSKTSDSILARLSRGEYVIKARAVDRYGPGLFAALNELRLPKFSLGGFVDGITSSLASLAPAPVPAFAEGGMVAAPAGSGRAMVPVNIHLDGQRYPMLSDEQVASAVVRHALRQQRASAGRRPFSFAG